MQMLYLRYYVGGHAELSAADVWSLDNMVTSQEGGAITPNHMQVVQGYLIDAMREMKIDEASITGVTCLHPRAKQPRGAMLTLRFLCKV